MTGASIIVRTKNEAKDLADTLTGVFDQTLPPHEVIVIDSGSTDDTLAIASRFPVMLMEIAPQDWNYSRAINRAAARATGDLLVCLSAHCRPATSTWLESLSGHFDDPAVAGAWGPNLRPQRDALSGDSPLVQLPGTYTAETWTWGLSNGNSAIRRSLWRQVPFDESLPASEDKAWGLAMLNRGHVIVHDPAAAVWHQPHTPANAYRRNQAVQAGLRMMFPEIQTSPPVQLGIVVRRAGALLRVRASDPDPAALMRDIRRLPGVIAALIGGVAGARRRSGPMPHIPEIAPTDRPVAVPARLRP